MDSLEEEKTLISDGINGLNERIILEAFRKSLDQESAFIDIGGFD